MRSATVAAILVAVIAGAGLLMAGEGIASQRSYAPETGLTNPNPVDVAPLGNHTIWATNLSNPLEEDWNMNVSFGFTGNSTTIVLDVNDEITYARAGWGCIAIGVPPGPCGIGFGFRFTLPPGSNRDLRVIIHNNNTAIETLNDTSVSYSYVTYPNSVVGTRLSYLGGVVVAAGLLILITGAVRSSRATRPTPPRSLVQPVNKTRNPEISSTQNGSGGKGSGRKRQSHRDVYQIHRT